MANIALKDSANHLLRMLVAFEHRNFRLLWTGRFSSNMGRMMRVFLRAWVVWQLTDSPLLMGVVISSLSWPMLFMPFIGGIVADKIDRKQLLIVTETLLVILWTIVSVLLTLDLIQWWHFIVSSVCSGVIQSFGRPGHLAMVADVVDRKTLPNAVALDSAAQTWPGVAGPALGALLIPFVGVAGGFWFTTFLQLVTVVTIFLLDWQNTDKSQSDQSTRSSFVEGFRHIRGEPTLLGLVALGMTSALFAQSYSFLLPAFADEILHLGDGTRGAQGLGVLMTGAAVGGAIGSLTAVSLSNFKKRGALLFFAVICFSLLVMAFSRSEVFVISFGILFFMRVMGMITQTTNITAMQLLAPDHLRGRVMSLRVFTMGLSPIGVMFMGALSEPSVLGIQNAVMLGGIVYAFVGVILFGFMPSLRKFE